METITKEIILYVSSDGLEHKTPKECKEWEVHLKIQKLHQNLIDCVFHSRCKIIPYYHNVDIKFIGSRNMSPTLAKDNSYLLMGGRMGNGDDRIRYKLRGSTIAMIRYNTDDNSNREQEYMLSMPSKWIDMPITELEEEVENFIENRKVFKKVVTYEPVIKYVEV